jgi:hypothetical protein
MLRKEFVLFSSEKVAVLGGAFEDYGVDMVQHNSIIART